MINQSNVVKKIWRYAIMALTVFFIVFPFYIIFVTSLMDRFEALAGFKMWPEWGVTYEHYETVLFDAVGGYSVMVGLWNTLKIYVPSTIVGVLVSAMSAFAFAKMRFKLSGAMFAVLMATMMIPNTMNLIVSYYIFDALNWIDTPFPLMIPKMFGGISIVFFLRQFYMGIPDDLIGCAKIDGLGFFGIFLKIMLPLSVPVLLSQFILTFIVGYNDYMGPLLYLTRADQATLQIVLAQYEEPYLQNWPRRMAGCFVAMLPLIILYFISQKFITRGLSISSGFKG